MEVSISEILYDRVNLTFKHSPLLNVKGTREREMMKRFICDGMKMINFSPCVQNMESVKLAM